MTFDEVVAYETFYTLDVVYGGIALKSSGLTADQKYLFIDWFNHYAQANPLLTPDPLKAGVETRDDLILAYDSFAHISPLKYPRVLSLARVDVGPETEITAESWLVNDLQLSVSTILDKTFDNKVYMYTHSEIIELRKYMRLAKVKRPINLASVPYDYLFDSVEQHAAMLEIEIRSEHLRQPCVYLKKEESTDRLKTASIQRASACAEIMLSI